MARNAKNQPDSRLNLNLRFFFVPGLMLILLITPFMNGLYFQPDVLAFQVAVGVVWIFCVFDQVLRREPGLARTPLDMAVAALLLAYILSLAGAVSMRSAIGEALKMLVYAMVYWMAFRAVQDENSLDRVLKVIFWAGTGAAALSIAAVAGFVSLPQDVHNAVPSTIGYKNALAVYMGAVSLIGLGLGVKTRSSAERVLYSLGCFLGIVVILGSQSRAGWVLYPIAAAALVALLPRNRRIKALYHLFIFLGAGLIASRFFYEAAKTGTGTDILVPLEIGLAAVAVLQLLYIYIERSLRRSGMDRSIQRLAAAGGLAYFLIVFAVYIYYASAAYPVGLARIMPKKVVARAQTISSGDPSWQNRLEMYGDAFKIVKDYPLVGAGGGAWTALYRSHAGKPYYVNDPHSSLMKTWLEAGIPGILAYLALWAGVIMLLARFLRRKREPGLQTSVWAGVTAAGIIMVHSLFDFTLTIGTLAVLLFALLGAVQGGVVQALSRNSRWRPYYGASAPRLITTAAVGLALGLLVVYPSWRFYNAGVLGAAGAKAMLEKRLDQSAALYARASALDPFTASYYADTAQIKAAQAIMYSDARARREALELARQASRREPCSQQVTSTLIKVYSLLGESDRVIQEARRLVKIDPLSPSHYEILAQSLLAGAVREIRQGQPQTAESLIEQAEELPLQMANKKLDETAKMKLLMGQAAFIKGDFDRALNIFKEIENDKEIGDQVRLWQAAACKRSGDRARALVILEDLKKAKPESLRGYPDIAATPNL